MEQKIVNLEYGIVNWNTVDVEDFWRIADNIRDSTLEKANDMFSYLEHADLETLKSILVQYRHFTVYYIPDLALLVARINNGKMRSFLGDILSDELGHGDSSKAHPYLYDKFLNSIGVTDKEIQYSALKSNIQLLDDARDKLIDPRNSQEYAIGLRGMGGECICQVYITQLYESMMKNPFILENKSQIDWHFWDIHVGDHDIEHARKTRELIDAEIVSKEGGNLLDLGLGYGESMESWEIFWNNIFQSVKCAEKTPERTSVASTVDLKVYR